jgi:hypothetical protein
MTSKLGLNWTMDDADRVVENYLVESRIFAGEFLTSIQVFLRGV